MFCSNCGTQLPDNQNFCQKCGKPQQHVSQGKQTTISESQDSLSQDDAIDREVADLRTTWKRNNPVQQDKIEREIADLRAARSSELNPYISKVEKMNELDKAILDNAQHGWRLVFRDEEFAQMLYPKDAMLAILASFIPPAAFGLAIFISIVTRDFNGATSIYTVLSSIGLYCMAFGAIVWMHMKDKSLFLYFVDGQVKIFRS